MMLLSFGGRHVDGTNRTTLSDPAVWPVARPSKAALKPYAENVSGELSVIEGPCIGQGTHRVARTGEALHPFSPLVASHLTSPHVC